MKILMMSDLSPKSKEGSGAERFMEFLSEGMRDAGFEVDIASFFLKTPDPTTLVDYDLIHIHNFSMMPVSFQRVLIDRTVDLPPIVFTVHDYTYFCRMRHGLNSKYYPCPFFGQDRTICVQCVPYAEGIEEGLLGAASIIVADCTNMAMIYKKHLPDGTAITPVLLGIPIVEREHKTKPRNTFLYMGRHSYEKGIFEMIAAFKGVHAKHPETRLILTHTGRETHGIKLQVERAGLKDVVTLTGKVSREQQEIYLSDCLAVLAPSVWEEPFNLTITEAWGFHRPVIASRIGAHVELLSISNGGLLYDPYDTIAFSEAMLDLYRNQARANEMGENGNKAIEAFFNQKRVVDNYIAIYMNVTGLRK